MNENSLNFEAPSFFKRLKGMLGVDFYRLFHTPLYYIFLAIAAIIPALVSMGNKEGSMYTNAWQIIASNEPLYVASDMGQYANMNMVYIFGGIMISIFIGHDYRSGYVKQLFTTHPKKEDYILSKSIIGAFSMACMCITYLIGGVASAIFGGLSFQTNVGSLLLAILSKILMSMGWASLYSFINVIFRKHFGLSIVLSFILGTGIIIIGVSSLTGNSSVLNLLLYGSSVYACLNSSGITLLVCFGVSLMWTMVYNVVGSIVLNHCDVY